MSRYIGPLILIGVIGATVVFWKPTICEALNNLTNGQFDMCSFQSTAPEATGGDTGKRPKVVDESGKQVDTTVSSPAHKKKLAARHQHLVTHHKATQKQHAITTTGATKQPHAAASVVKAHPTAATKTAVHVTPAKSKCSGVNCRFDSALGGFFDSTHCKCKSGLGAYARSNLAMESHYRMSGW